jgi:hypothetical protein
MEELAVAAMTLNPFGQLLPISSKDLPPSPPRLSPLESIIVVNPPRGFFPLGGLGAGARAPRIALLERDRRIAGP